MEDIDELIRAIKYLEKILCNCPTQTIIKVETKWAETCAWLKLTKINDRVSIIKVFFITYLQSVLTPIERNGHLNLLFFNLQENLYFSVLFF